MNLMIICIFLFDISSQSTTLYRTKGLNAIEINLDQFSEFPIGQTTIVITLTTSLQSSYPILSYCPTSNLQIIKTILSSMNQVKAHIESNKKQCIFDNNAVIYNKELQQITLFDYQDENSEWIYNRFSCFGIKNRKLSIYIYSNDDSEYELNVQKQNVENCQKNCGSIENCSHSSPSVCECSTNTLGSNCEIQLGVLNTSQQYQFALTSNSSKLFSLPFSNTQNSIQIKVDSSFKINIILACQFEKEYMPFAESQIYEITKIDSGSITYYNDNLKDCYDKFNQINSQIQGNINPKLIVLFSNSENFVTADVKIDVQEQSQINLKNNTIYYILAGSFSALLLALLLIGVGLYLMKKKKNLIHSENRRIQTNRSSSHTNRAHDRQISQDFIPVELYEQVLQEYPGLNTVSDCQICLVEFQNQDLVKLTYCLHLFHSSCLDAWRKKIQSCPFCRTELTKKIFLEKKEQLEIFQLGYIAGDDVQIDEKKAEEIKQRQFRLNQLKKIQSPDSVQTIKDTSPSPQSGEPLQIKLKEGKQP